jgi:hypothetical protein
VLDNCWAFHGRVASREQIQVQISYPAHKEWLGIFLEWWRYGFESWRERASSEETLTFVSELGPNPYAIVDQDGRIAESVGYPRSCNFSTAFHTLLRLHAAVRA